MFLSRSLAGLAFFGLAGAATADIIFVPRNHSTIQAAIDASVDGDRISVAPGTYLETIDFLDRSITVVSEGGAEVTTIDGQGTGPVVTCAGGQGNETVLEGFTVTGGAVEGKTDAGGGMRILQASPTVRGCRFVGNSVTSTVSAGGGMYVQTGAPLLIDCDFVENQAGDENSDIARGGGLVATNTSSPIIAGCRFIDNVVLSGRFFSESRGGGLYVSSTSTATLVDCALSGNAVTGEDVARGGGLYVQIAAGCSLTRCLVQDNVATIPKGVGKQGPARGGGLMALGDVEIFESRFVGNMAVQGAGARLQSNDALIVNSEFCFNATVDPGNVLLVSGGGLEVAAGSTATVTNCTFAYNFAHGSGGSVYICEASSFVARNCILWHNEPAGPGCFLDADFAYCNVEGGVPGEGNIDADPLFAGGCPSLRLGPGSPSIDAGQNSAVPPSVEVDIDGQPRFVDQPAIPDSGDGTPPLVDMGAYELQLECAADLDGDGSVDVDDLVAVILAWGTPDGDVNGDGTTDVDDLVQVVLDWGPCP